ncbi:hypothetical protein DB30_03366 [Enhygromyxa salina]|uniref:Uncharacterized protein n=2 Tax=Enhygromyxa salina TaxID=215803 RepID=A0A0C2CP84_9BACT|nr:hypothetical protein DB30_03366 [Enhygromyxa salina]
MLADRIVALGAEHQLERRGESGRVVASVGLLGQGACATHNEN